MKFLWPILLDRRRLTVALLLLAGAARAQEVACRAVLAGTRALVDATVHGLLDRTERVHVKRGCRVARQGQRPGAAQRAHSQQLGDAGAARDVGLQDVHRRRRQHPLEVREVVAVLPGRDLHPRGGPVADQP